MKERKGRRKKKDSFPITYNSDLNFESFYTVKKIFFSPQHPPTREDTRRRRRREGRRGGKKKEKTPKINTTVPLLTFYSTNVTITRLSR